MEKFFNAKSVAIVGVSAKPYSIANPMIHNLNEFGYKGSLYAVGKRTEELFGKPVYASVLDIPDGVELAFVLVPAKDVSMIAEQCGQKGIKRLVIPTAGFSEFHDKGRVIEEALLKACREYGIRFIGPNCYGTANLHNGLFLPFGPQRVIDWRKGPVGIISQSGNVAMSYSQCVSNEKIGVSKMASIGNKLNVDEVDLLEYFLEDADTEIVVLYLEGFSRARALYELICSAKKPIIIQKSNISSSSHGIAGSHTNALASDDKVVDAAFRQAGAIRVNSVEEMINCLKVLCLPRLKGNRLACMASTGGKSIMAADECTRNGFSLSELPQSITDWVQSKGQAGIISVTNPMDLGDIFDLKIHREIIRKLRESPNVDGIYYNLTYAQQWDGYFNFQRFFDYCSRINEGSEKPVFIRADPESPLGLIDMTERITVPIFKTMPETFEAMRKVMDVQQREKKTIPKVQSDIDPSGRIHAIVDRVRRQGKTFLGVEGYEILEAAGIPMANYDYIPREKTVEMNPDLNFPVVLKAVGDDLLHKTEVGGVRLNLQDHNALAEALEAMASAEGLSSARGFLIQEMVEGTTIEVIVGAKRDPQFGPVVMVGLGGVMVELLDDIALALAPIDMDVAGRMVSSLKGYPLLNGFRGAAPADVESLCRILKQVSDLMMDFSVINELDLNPVKVFEKGQGSWVVDCKILLAEEVSE